MIKIVLTFEYNRGDMKDQEEASRELAIILEKLKGNVNWLKKSEILEMDD